MCTEGIKTYYNRLMVFSLLSLFLIPCSAYAVDYTSTGATTEQTVQLRTGAEFTKKWDCGVRLSMEEELLFNLYDVESGTLAKDQTPIDTAYGPLFYKSYTTLALAYAHPEFTYLKLDAGYTLRLAANKGWSDPNKFLRHRVFFGVTGSYKIGQLVKLSLREHFLCNMRTDSVNTDEKNRYQWLMRTRLGAEFTVPGQPIKPYLWGELENTLNAPEYQQKDGRQFISGVRAQVGIKWRMTKMHSMEFFYRFQYGYDRDVNVNRSYYEGKRLKLRLDEKTSYLHAFGVMYHLDW